jgi:predicted dehydrogenase
MRRVRVAIIGAGTITEWAILPALSGPDIASPPDTGAWWGRRPTTSNARFQPAARPEVVALFDADFTRAQRVGGTARVGAIYNDWRAMLREMEPDAILCAAGADVAAEIMDEERDRDAWLWIDGPPTTSLHELHSQITRGQGRALQVWCAHPMSRAQSHRTARELRERDAIGPVTALVLRWPRPLQAAPHAALSDYVGITVSPANYAAAYDAFSWLIDAASPPSPGNKSVRPQGVRVVATEHGGAASLWMQFQHGLDGRSLAATAVFASADPWNSPLPRLEMCGTQGRSLVCEGGRRVWLYAPRETARLLEPPGLALQISPSNFTGIAEDLKAFLARAAGVTDAVSGFDSGLADAAMILRLMEAVDEAMACGLMVEADLRRTSPLHLVAPPPVKEAEPDSTQTHLGLPLEGPPPSTLVDPGVLRLPL